MKGFHETVPSNLCIIIFLSIKQPKVLYDCLFNVQARGPAEQFEVLKSGAIANAEEALKPNA